MPSAGLAQQLTQPAVLHGQALGRGHGWRGWDVCIGKDQFVEHLSVMDVSLMICLCKELGLKWCSNPSL